MEYSHYDPQIRSDMRFEGHHDLADTLSGDRHNAGPDTEMHDSFSYVNDMNLFGILPDNHHFASYNNPSMTSMLFDDINEDAAVPQTQNRDNAPVTNISPLSMWLGSGSSLSTAAGGGDGAGVYQENVSPNNAILKPHLAFGQPVASPDEDMTIDTQSPPRTSSKRGSTASAKKRRDSQMDNTSIDNKQRNEEVDEDVGPGAHNKREKYREKNRVAAAKCRAKKKDNVDTLEDRHRTHSVLNVALKQTEQSLRDELSYWRTQALQHSFCDCQSIQDYNMRKARNLAAENVLGDTPSSRPRSSDSHHTCTRPLHSPSSLSERRPDSAKISIQMAATPRRVPAAAATTAVSFPLGGPAETASDQIGLGRTSLQHRRAKASRSKELRFDNIREDSASRGSSSSGSTS